MLTKNTGTSGTSSVVAGPLHQATTTAMFPDGSAQAPVLEQSVPTRRDRDFDRPPSGLRRFIPLNSVRSVAVESENAGQQPKDGSNRPEIRFGRIEQQIF
jgi:hypothetical protein